MPRTSNIRWRDKDVKAVDRAVRNFNSKLNRLKKKNPDIASFLPDSVTKKELVGKVTTRSDFKRELNALTRFSKRGSEAIRTTESGVSITQYEYREVVIKTQVVNRQRARKQIDATQASEEGVGRQVGKLATKPKKGIDKVSPRDYQKYLESLEREIQANFELEQLEIYKENYLRGIKNGLGAGFGESAQGLVDKIKEMDAGDLYEITKKNPKLIIDFYYEPQEASVIVENVMSELERIL